MTEKSYYLALQRPDGWPNEIVDGPHSTPEGVAKAQVIYERIMGKDEGQNYMMVSAEPLPELTVEINEEAAAECARLLHGGMIDGETARGMSASIDANHGFTVSTVEGVNEDGWWRCEFCECLNAPQEWCCYRCREGAPE